jgi:uncharacterized protein YciI
LWVLTSGGGAEEFAAADPFVLHGVVQSARVLEWRDVLG